MWLFRAGHNNLLPITFIIHKPTYSIPERNKIMAERVVFELAGKVFEVLGSFALQEIKLANGVKQELDKLKSSFHNPK